MTYVFFMGLLLGLRHALDADHIAAVAALATRVRSVGEIVRVGLSWGVGHGLALFAATSVVFIVDFEESGRLAVAFEFLVGAMLMLLGLDVVRRIIRDRVHAHAHHHAGRDIHMSTSIPTPAPANTVRPIMPMNIPLSCPTEQRWSG